METILETKHISKYFGSLAANEDINLTIKQGSVHAIIGENGAGKSTLMNMLAGVLEPSGGSLILHGKPCRFKNATEASRAGIGMVQQEFMLFPGLTVLENIVLGDECLQKGCFLNMRQGEQKVRAICEKYGFHFDLHVPIEQLPVVLRQQVEIVKVLYRNAEIIILDEPTAVLPPQEIEGLFKAVRFLIEQNKTILFITHKLKEVLEISDSITVMKKGRVVDTIPVQKASEAILTNMMVGRDVMLDIRKSPGISAQNVLEVTDVTVYGNMQVPKIKNISLHLKQGEILGIVGIAGNGQSELVEAITGARDFEGTIKIQNNTAEKKRPWENRMLGMGYVPQDRKLVGSSDMSSLVENAMMGTHLKQFKKNKVLIDYNEGRRFTGEIIDKFKVKVQSADDTAASLSGGNLQKLIVGREFSQRNKVLVIEDPTRGIDIGAIEFIWNEIVKQAQEDEISVLLITYDLNEAMALSDRILVLYDGEIKKELVGPAYDEREIGLHMLGGNTP